MSCTAPSGELMLNKFSDSCKNLQLTVGKAGFLPKELLASDVRASSQTAEGPGERKWLWGYRSAQCRPGELVRL